MRKIIKANKSIASLVNAIETQLDNLETNPITSATAIIDENVVSDLTSYLNDYANDEDCTIEIEEDGDYLNVTMLLDSVSPTLSTTVSVDLNDPDLNDRTYMDNIAYNTIQNLINELYE